MSGQGEYRNFAQGADERQQAIGVEPMGQIHGQLDYCLLPDIHSAKTTCTRWQFATLLLTVGAAIFGAYFYWELTVITGSVLFSMFYLTVVFFRLFVLADYKSPPTSHVPFSPDQFDETYVILIALYKEANQVSDLVAAIDQLKWQTENKTVRLICEADDFETIGAIEKLSLPQGFEFLIVPAGNPRTKPRALNFGLSQISGDYLVIYDAEDRPHPDQLLEAAGQFSYAPKELVCLQAPLKIDNANESILTRLFSIEYDTLFLGILPSLTKWKAPMPLGGTSNHFRGLR